MFHVKQLVVSQVFLDLYIFLEFQVENSFFAMFLILLCFRYVFNFTMFSLSFLLYLFYHIFHLAKSSFYHLIHQYFHHTPHVPAQNKNNFNYSSFP